VVLPKLQHLRLCCPSSCHDKIFRWHETSCTSPDVFVEAETPRYRACGSSPNLAEIKTKQVEMRAQLSAPQDEPTEPLNLWWPSGVPYISKPKQQSNNGGNAKGTAASYFRLPGHNLLWYKGKNSTVAGKTNDASHRETTTSLPQLGTEGLPVYDALGPDEFRLLCLSAVEDGNHPIHRMLETYRHDDRPEYEAVSYTWGGENGDKSLQRPVYLGSS
jgi:hypothetical protein